MQAGATGAPLTWRHSVGVCSVCKAARWLVLRVRRCPGAATELACRWALRVRHCPGAALPACAVCARRRAGWCCGRAAALALPLPRRPSARRSYVEVRRAGVLAALALEAELLWQLLDRVVGRLSIQGRKGCLYLQKPAERFFTAGVALVCVCVSSAAAASLLHLRRDGAAGPRGVKAGDD